MRPTAEDGYRKIAAAYKGAGCSHCNDTGYHGQVGVFEFLQVTPMIRRMIARGASEEDIWTEARSNGSRSLYEDALEKVEQGITSIDEILVKVPATRICTAQPARPDAA